LDSRSRATRTPRCGCPATTRPSARRPAHQSAIGANPDVAAWIRQQTVDLLVARQAIDVLQRAAESEESGIARPKPHAAIRFRDRNHRCAGHHVWWNNGLKAALAEAVHAMAESADQNAAATLGRHGGNGARALPMCGHLVYESAVAISDDCAAAHSQPQRAVI
jgi:hypothetical protein